MNYSTNRLPVLYIVIPCYNEQEVLPITSKLFEDKIIELHKSKRKLAEDLLDGTAVFNQITKEELIRLLKN